MTTVVIGVLAAVVLPALAKQTSAADPARIASDLNNIKMGIEVFSQNLRPDFPGDLEDLVNQPADVVSGTESSSSEDLAFDGTWYANKSNWQGPYVAQTLPELFTIVGSTSWRAGAAGFYENTLQLCDIDDTVVCGTGGDSPFVAVKINGLTLSEAEGSDVMLDGTPANSTTGLFRFEVSGTSYNAFYYAVPFVP